MDQASSNSQQSSSMRFLSFANDKEDAEKEAKLKEAASRIEQAIAREKSLSELVDYKPPPEEAIDLTNDTRSLYERLLEQRNRKKESLDESHKLSNLITRLDEDEAEYLNELSKIRQEEELKKRIQVYDVLDEKKRIIEQKSIEEERKLKESYSNLIGTTKINRPISFIKSKLLSSIKIRPKRNDLLHQSSKLITRDIKQDESMPHSAHEDDKHTREGNPRIKRSPDDEKGNPTMDVNNLPEAKRSKRDELTTREVDNQDGKAPRCSCTRSHDVMRCIGILPSLPIVDKDPSSTDSDQSDNNMTNTRLVPMLKRHK